MATRANIGIQNESGTISAIYTHYDGYIEYMGRMLLDHYNSETQAQNLIEGGSISTLQRRPFPIYPGFNFENHRDVDPDSTVYYHRDRGESWEDNKPRTFSNVTEWGKTDIGYIEYLYLWHLGCWHVMGHETGRANDWEHPEKSNPGELIPLPQALAKIEKIA